MTKTTAFFDNGLPRSCYRTSLAMTSGRRCFDYGLPRLDFVKARNVAFSPKFTPYFFPFLSSSFAFLFCAFFASFSLSSLSVITLKQWFEPLYS